MRRLAALLLLAPIFALLWSLPASAGQLILFNKGPNDINCRTDGGVDVTVPAFGQSLITITGSGLLSWIDCGGLRATNVNVSETSPDQYLMFNGKQDHVLNVLLYPYLPNVMSDDYQSMVMRILYEYMLQDPTALLNVVVSADPKLSVYDEANWPNIFGEDGFDVVEIDTLLLQSLVDGRFIREPSVMPPGLVPQALDAIKVEGTPFAIPTTGCINLTFGRNSDLGKVTSPGGLVDFWKKQPNRLKAIGDLSGTTSLTGGVLSAYTDIFGYDPTKLIQILDNPESNIPNEVIDGMAEILMGCQIDEENVCLSGKYKKSRMADFDFENNVAPTMFGYTERAACNRVLSQPENGTVAIQLPYGTKQQPLVYIDGVVANAKRCRNNPKCSGKVDGFMSYLTSLMTRSWIAMGDDLPYQQPRYILPLYNDFYDFQKVQNNFLYKQYFPVLKRSKPMINRYSRQAGMQVVKYTCTQLAIRGIKCIIK